MLDVRGSAHGTQGAVKAGLAWPRRRLNFGIEKGGIMAKGGTVQQKSPLQTDTPTIEEQVRIRAHEIWVEGGGEGGSELDDWLRAEEEILCAEDIA